MAPFITVDDHGDEWEVPAAAVVGGLTFNRIDDRIWNPGHVLRLTSTFELHDPVEQGRFLKVRVIISLGTRDGGSVEVLDRERWEWRTIVQVERTELVSITEQKHAEVMGLKKVEHDALRNDEADLLYRAAKVIR